MADHGTFMWNELMTGDVGASKAFYQQVLGWNFQEMDVGAGAYNIAMAGETAAAGMMKMDGPEFEGTPPQWFAYIAVDDVDAVAAKVAAAGGNVLREAFEIPTVGRVAIIADNNGAAFGVMTPAPEG